MRIVVCSHYLLKLFRGWTLSVPPFNHLRRVRDLNPRIVFTTYLFSKQTPSPTWVTLQKKQNLTQDELRFDSLVLRCGETTDCSALLLLNFHRPHSHRNPKRKRFYPHPLILLCCYGGTRTRSTAVILNRGRPLRLTPKTSNLTDNGDGFKRGFANSPSHNSCF